MNKHNMENAIKNTTLSLALIIIKFHMTYYTITYLFFLLFMK